MKKLLICDLDNTLYDWVGYFVPSFYAMVDEAVKIIGCDQDLLLDDLKRVHQKHNDSEHPFALLEANVVKSCYPDKNRRELAQIFDPAFHAFNSERKRRLQLYPGVRSGLDQLSASGVKLVAHTEGKLFSVLDRLRRLELLEYFSKVYCRERSNSSHVRPEVGRRWLSDFPMERVTELSHHQRKPSSDVLEEICQKESIGPGDTVYIGDSIARDMMMAKAVGVLAVWAKYGTNNARDDYAALVRVTHWSDADVKREKDLKEQSVGIEPDFVLEHSFSEILTCFSDA
tara:strand:+ start:382 stop:1239 length:858 start_codon:yes stop_codon:yes gene_type:complete